jgi:hypothetical protein
LPRHLKAGPTRRNCRRHGLIRASARIANNQRNVGGFLQILKRRVLEFRTFNPVVMAFIAIYHVFTGDASILLLEEEKKEPVDL